VKTAKFVLDFRFQSTLSLPVFEQHNWNLNKLSKLRWPIHPCSAKIWYSFDPINSENESKGRPIP